MVQSGIVTYPAPPKPLAPPPLSSPGHGSRQPASKGKEDLTAQYTSEQAATKIAAVVRGWLVRKRRKDTSMVNCDCFLRLVAERRNNVISELIVTEKSYIMSLRTLAVFIHCSLSSNLKQFIAPFETASATGKPIIGPQDIYDVKYLFFFS